MSELSESAKNEVIHHLNAIESHRTRESRLSEAGLESHINAVISTSGFDFLVGTPSGYNEDLLRHALFEYAECSDAEASHVYIEVHERPKCYSSLRFWRWDPMWKERIRRGNIPLPAKGNGVISSAFVVPAYYDGGWIEQTALTIDPFLGQAFLESIAYSHTPKMRTANTI